MRIVHAARDLEFSALNGRFAGNRETERGRFRSAASSDPRIGWGATSRKAVRPSPNRSGNRRNATNRLSSLSIGPIPTFKPETKSKTATLPYNYQVAGKHPATGFDSLTFQPHTRPGGSCVYLCTSIFLWAGCGGGAERLAGMLERRSVNLITCPLTPFLNQAGVRAPSRTNREIAPCLRPPKINRLRVRLSTHSSMKSLPFPRSIYATGRWVNWTL